MVLLCFKIQFYLFNLTSNSDNPNSYLLYIYCKISQDTNNDFYQKWNLLCVAVPLSKKNRDKVFFCVNGNLFYKFKVNYNQGQKLLDLLSLFSSIHPITPLNEVFLSIVR